MRQAIRRAASCLNPFEWTNQRPDVAWKCWRLRLGIGLLGFGGALFTAGTAVAEPLVQYDVDQAAYSIPKPLTDEAGDPGRGLDVAVNRKKGNCLACHAMPVDQPFQGAIGPPLQGVGTRYEAGQLRLRVVNAKAFNPMTIMPGFYRVEDLHRVTSDFEGKPILNAQEVEDIVAYLITLK